MNDPVVKDRTLLSRAFSFVKPHQKLMWAGGLILPIVALTRLIRPYLLKQAIDGPIRQKDIDGIALIAFIYLGVVFAEGALNLIRCEVAANHTGTVGMGRTKSSGHEEVLAPVPGTDLSTHRAIRGMSRRVSSVTSADKRTGGSPGLRVQRAASKRRTRPCDS